MQRYFFHVHSGGPEPDGEGADLADEAAAALEAARFAGEILAHEPRRLLDNRELRIEVTDGERRPLYAVRLVAEALRRCGPANED